MKTEFKDKKIIIKHSSGHIDEIDKARLEAFKQYLFNHIQGIRQNVNLIKQYILNIEKS